MKRTVFVISFFIFLFAIMAGCAASQPKSEQTEKESVLITADYPHYSSIEDLREKADLVVSGTVLTSHVEALNIKSILNDQDKNADPGGDLSSFEMVYTIYTLKIDKHYKGDAVPDDTIEIKILGGTLDNIVYKFEEAAKLEKNSKYILFLATYANSPASLLNPIQAIYEGKPGADGNYGQVNPKNDLKLSESRMTEMISGKGE